MDDWLELEQDINTRHHILSGWVDHEAFGIRGFCHAHNKSSRLIEYLDKDSHKNYDDRSSAHEQGKDTEYLVECALGAIPNLSVRTPKNWNSQADVFLKWDLVLQWKGFSFPIQVKSSLRGVEDAISDMSGNSQDDLGGPIREDLDRSVDTALYIRSLYYGNPRKLPDKTDQYENPIALRFKQKQAYFEKMSATTKLSIPIFVSASTQDHKVAIKGIMETFGKAFGISTKEMQECEFKAISLFEDKIKVPNVIVKSPKGKADFPRSPEVEERIRRDKAKLVE